MTRPDGANPNDTLLRTALHLLGGSSTYAAVASRWLRYTFQHTSFISFGMRLPVDAPDVIEQANNKILARQILSDGGLPVIEWSLLPAGEPAAVPAGTAWTLKPAHGMKGAGVFANLVGDEVATYSRVLGRSHRYLLLEPFVAGRCFRVVCLDGEVLGAYEKRPSTLVGDGRRPVGEIIDDYNRSAGLPIPIDAEVEHALHVQNLSLSATPYAGQCFYPTLALNLARGATWLPLTRLQGDELGITNLSCSAARAIGLRLSGVDAILDDAGNAHILEVNPSPGLVGISFSPDFAEVNLLAPMRILRTTLEFFGCERTIHIPEQTVLRTDQYRHIAGNLP